MWSSTADKRRVLLRDGSVTWLFPTLEDEVEVGDVLRLLTQADKQLERLGHVLGVHALAQTWDPPSHRLTYYRLGPAPRFPTTELICEGWSDEVYVLVRLWTPAEPMTAERVGPPWIAGAWIELPCDVEDPRCPGHLIEERIGSTTMAPTAAAMEVNAIADWVFQILTATSPNALRRRDAPHGHPVSLRTD